MSKILSSVSEFLSFNNDGSLNWEESSAHIRAAVEAEIEQNRAFDSSICAALNSVYNKFAINETMHTNDAISFAAMELASANPAMMNEIRAKVAEYVKRSPQFKGQRGRTGGLIRQYK